MTHLSSTYRKIILVSQKISQGSEVLLYLLMPLYDKELVFVSLVQIYHYQLTIIVQWHSISPSMAVEWAATRS